MCKKIANYLDTITYRDLYLISTDFNIWYNQYKDKESIKSW